MPGSLYSEVDETYDFGTDFFIGLFITNHLKPVVPWSGRPAIMSIGGIRARQGFFQQRGLPAPWPARFAARCV